MALAPGSTRAVTRWTTRIIPLVLAGCVGYATWVTIVRICVDYLLRTKDQTGLAIAILVLYCVFFTLMVVTYLRTLIIINTNPGLVPLGHTVPHDTEQYRMSLRGGDGKDSRRRHRRRRSRREADDLESQPYTQAAGIEPDLNPDSPGLEQFYSKDVFVCATDGRPVWCSSCRNWKPDRSHHSSEMERCVRKMDHYCPWVGGIVSETFLAISAYTLSDQITNYSVDGTVIGVLALSAFFGLFVATMTLTSFRFIFMNLTNVDVLSYKSKVYQLAVRIPRGSPATSRYPVITYPLPQPPPPPMSSGPNGSLPPQQQQLNGHINGNGNGNGYAEPWPGPQYQTYQGSAPPPNGQHASSRDEPVSSRDLRAQRTFAIVRTERGENPWDRGYYGNWKSVMGGDVLDWLLPFRPSPCVREEDNRSFYRLGPVYREICRRYDLPPLPREESDGGVEMREV
ncbi:uncharacterized protein E0L32_005041 [Thyridium curvatum]|uniref:Palmitoyltransferase n=1 Tax=Thyridium curvatum TaxID=1093900 RepID=A0A507AY76_9PEZI|nr:uncharacterized protein E0L32_005041 [Thyridium curvatum]TPX14932.1 hypothetical protein E0L32_005041 [Thyridium curvatum]